MERAERFVFLGAGCLFGILVPVLWVMQCSPQSRRASGS
jgi:hypothetical protein